MNDIDHYIAELERASLSAEKALEISFSDDYASYPETERHTWTAAAIIHCDIFRYFIAYQTATRQGVARLLWIGDIVCTLWEARKWFYQCGNRSLRDIASSNGYGLSVVNEELKRLKEAYPLGGIDAYEQYRNKAGHHYDTAFVNHFHAFSQMEYAPFHSVFLNYSYFAHHWLKLCLAVIQHGHRPSA